jgi:TRAP-type C4-dicarboxylate transport system substrate-binding protein
MSLERGLVESHFTHYAVIYAFKTIDLMPYHQNFGDFGAQCSIDTYIFNQDVWDDLGPELQAVVEEATDWRVTEVATRDIAEVQRSRDYGASLGHKFVNATDEQMQLWRDAFLPYHEYWINQTGRNSRDIYNRAVELVSAATK